MMLTEPQTIFNEAGIPEIAVRISFLIPLLFIIVIGIILIYIKMKESDEKAGV